MLKSSERRNEDAETKGGKTKKTHRLKQQRTGTQSKSRREKRERAIYPPNQSLNASKYASEKQKTQKGEKTQ